MDALTSPNKTLFLSYSRKQTNWCDELYTAIDTYTPYQRWRDNKIPESADWWDSICLNIEGCYAFVMVLTQDYLDSVYCMGELEYALKLKKPVIALMLQDVAYPLNEQRLQFARVNGLDIREVINKVQTAVNQITFAYIQGEFSTDIHPRKHLRPRVPTPKAATATPEEDAVLDAQVKEVRTHGQIPTRDLIRRYGEEKDRNFQLARELLDKIKQRQDVSVFFDIDEEDEELRITEQRFAEEEAQRQYLKQARGEYDDLAHYVTNVRPKAALKAIRRFMDAYPDYGDPQDLLRKFLPSSKSLLPAPFDWIEIPKKGYSIAKYPVTNAQFQVFVDASNGYNNASWWDYSDAAKEWRAKNSLQTTAFPGNDHPRTNVSWYEAVAFCLWLSETTGEKIMLPTEDQWQYAAQGDDGRAYPWGNDWDCKRCNNSVKPCDSNATTPVRQYEGKGDSPFGIVDMAGNVWEWCLTDYDSKENNVNETANRRVLRGCSWDDYDTLRFRCDFRSWNYPHNWGNYSGFRLARS